MRNAVAGGFLACCALSLANAQSVTPEMFGALPTVSEVEISPDGKTIAMVQSAGTSVGLVFYDVSNPGAAPNGIGLGESKGRGIYWADDSHLLLLVARSYNLSTVNGLQKAEMERWMTVSRPSNKTAKIFDNELGWYLPHPGHLLAIPAQSGKAYFERVTPIAKIKGGPSRLGDAEWENALFEVNLDNGNDHLIGHAEPGTDEWILARDGSVLARIDFDAAGNQKIYAHRPGASELTLAATRAKGEALSFYGSAPTEGKLLVTAYEGDKRSLLEFDLASGEIGAKVYENANFDLDTVVFDFRSAGASAVHYVDDLPRAYHIDAGDRKAQDMLARSIPGAAPMIVSKSADGTKMIVKAIYSDHPDQFFLFNKPAKTMSMIAAGYQQLDGKVFAHKEKYDFVASDGLNIPGYLTVPQGASKSNMPMIILPHGGPAGRDDMSFDWWSFFYAARGYLVYQPNFRGSDGYGLAFKEAGYGEWGRKMQSDLTEGVKNLVADGIVDPNRVCIVGGSYGGYAALAGATLTPGVYACAVSVNGVSNLPLMIAQSNDDDWFEKRIGSRFRNAAELDAVSPAKIADRASAPILLIHGKDDIVVQIGQSRMMRDALKAAKKPYEYMELSGEDHWLSGAATRTEMLRASIAFIDKYIGASTN